MILAGIDEAGYGPLLGPLVVGCCAFEVGTSDEPASWPCLWQRLRKVASKTRHRSGQKLHVNDSKVVYSSSAGLKELEKSVLALVTACGGVPDSIERLLDHVSPHVKTDLPGYQWYTSCESEKFPIETDAASIRIFGNALRLEMQSTQTQCVHLAARVVLEAQLNRMLQSTRNKSNTLFSIAAIHLDYLLRTFGRRDLVIVCDRQGGREHYGSLLRLMFDQWALEVVTEKDGYSEYRLLQDSHTVRIIFREKAEAQCMPVALASMLSKYLRESLMHRFNAFWQSHLPGLVPTAGYYTDGQRFLQDVADKRRELGIPDDQLIRCR